jgi:hypothetical protein
MGETVRAAIRASRSPRARRAAVLLAVLLAGSWVTATSQGWIGAMPSHGHLLLGVEHGEVGTTRHIHHGDRLDRAQEALTVVESRAAGRSRRGAERAAESGGRRVLSLLPASATRPEINTWSFAGALGLAPVRAALDSGSPLPATGEGRRESRALAPPSPPPRALPARTPQRCATHAANSRRASAPHPAPPERG